MDKRVQADVLVGLVKFPNGNVEAVCNVSLEEAIRHLATLQAQLTVQLVLNRTGGEPRVQVAQPGLVPG